MKVLVLLSGGLDSTVSLAKAVSLWGSANVTALHMHYGQRHKIETEAAKNVAKFYNVRFIEKDLTSIFEFSDSAMLAKGKAVPHSTYEEQLEEVDIVDTYVPFRNGLFLSIAAAIAFSIEAREVWISAHRDDAAGSAYPDCSDDFLDAMEDAILLGTGEAVDVHAPFKYCTKADIVAMGLELCAPMNLSWSCYDPVEIDGQLYPCGTCGTCLDRIRAFQENAETDPVLYAPEQDAM